VSSRVDWKIRRTGEGSYEGWIILPVGMAQIKQAVTAPPGTPLPTATTAIPKPIAIKASSSTSAANALKAAAGVASSIVSNPLVSAIMPPGTGIAVKGIEMLSKSAAAGKLADAAGKLIGPGAKRLASALSSLF
jgi:hypothetical protein